MIARFAAATALSLTLGAVSAIAQQATTPPPAAQTPQAAPAQQGDRQQTTTTRTVPIQQQDTQQQTTTQTAPVQQGDRQQTTTQTVPVQQMDRQQQTTTQPGQQSMQAAQVSPLTEQQPGQWMADDLIGTNVYNYQNENIGDINDLVLDRDGRIVAVIVGVGGFLGIGQRDVAIPFEQVELKRESEVRQQAAGTTPATATRDATGATTGPGAAGTAGTGAAGTAGTTGTAAAPEEDEDFRIVVNATRDQLREMPAFTRLEERNRDRGGAGGNGAQTTPPAAQPGTGTQRSQ